MTRQIEKGSVDGLTMDSNLDLDLDAMRLRCDVMQSNGDAVRLSPIDSTGHEVSFFGLMFLVLGRGPAVRLKLPGSFDESDTPASRSTGELLLCSPTMRLMIQDRGLLPTSNNPNFSTLFDSNARWPGAGFWVQPHRHVTCRRSLLPARYVYSAVLLPPPPPPPPRPTAVCGLDTSRHPTRTPCRRQAAARQPLAFTPASYVLHLRHRHDKQSQPASQLAIVFGHGAAVRIYAVPDRQCVPTAKVLLALWLCDPQNRSISRVHGTCPLIRAPDLLVTLDRLAALAVTGRLVSGHFGTDVLCNHQDIKVSNVPGAVPVSLSALRRTLRTPMSYDP